MFIGITGGVGAGKSTILQILKDKYDAHLIMADDVAKDLMCKGKSAYRKIVQTFGEEILGDDKEIDRQKLSSIVFQDDEKLLTLNQIVHPLVKKAILKEKNVMLILAGSLISMMVSQTLSYGSPLYGRRTFQILLKQVQFRYYCEFYDSLTTRRELIERYAVTGGVPKYIESFVENPCQDIYDSIEQHILNPSSYLYTEPYFLLQQEVTEIGSYFSLLRAIAAGNSKLSAIASALSVKATGLTKYLKTLIDLDILEREVPVTEDNPEKSKKGLYRIKDNYLRFWFAFVYPNMSLLESGNRAIVLEKIRHGLHRGHTSFVYENVCQEKMWDLNTAGAWDFHFSKLGRYWDNSTEIDITALDPDGHNLILGECKFWNEPIGLGILRALEKKAPSVSWNRDDRKVHYILFSISGFTDELQAIAKEREDVLLCE